MPGWGTVVGWIFDRFPLKKESQRNKIDKLKKEMDELLKEKPLSARSASRYERLADELRAVEQAIKNG